MRKAEDTMFWAGIAFVVCANTLLSSADKTGKDSLLQEILFRSQQSNDDVNIDMITSNYDVNDVTELLENAGIDINNLMNIDDVSELMNIYDVTGADLEKLRVAIHSNSSCRCHTNHCECCKIVYLFWKIPIFKACIGVYYEGRDFVMRLKVYGITLVKHKLPLRDQKPVCARVMGVYDLCAHLYDVAIHNGVVHACLKITKPVEMDLKCFTLHRSSEPKEELLELIIERDHDSPSLEESETAEVE